MGLRRRCGERAGDHGGDAAAPPRPALSGRAMLAKLRGLPDEDLHVALVLVLTLGTGAVDAVSYFSLDHVFTANMSGNMALLGIGIANGLGTVTGNIYAFGGF